MCILFSYPSLLIRGWVSGLWAAHAHDVFWECNRVWSTAVFRAVVYCYFASVLTLPKVTGSQRSKVTVHVCVCVWVWVSVSVTFTFLLDPTSQILLYQHKVLQSFYMFLAPMQLVSSASLPWHRFILLTISVARDLKLCVNMVTSSCPRAGTEEPSPAGGGLHRASPAHASGCSYTSLVTWKQTWQVAFLVTLEISLFSILLVIPSVSN